MTIDNWIMLRSVEEGHEYSLAFKFWAALPYVIMKCRGSNRGPTEVQGDCDVMGSQNLGSCGPVRVDDLAFRHSFRYLKNCPTGRPGHLNIKTNTAK